MRENWAGLSVPLLCFLLCCLGVGACLPALPLCSLFLCTHLAQRRPVQLLERRKARELPKPRRSGIKKLFCCTDLSETQFPHLPNDLPQTRAPSVPTPWLSVCMKDRLVVWSQHALGVLKQAPCLSLSWAAHLCPTLEFIVSNGACPLRPRHAPGQI